MDAVGGDIDTLPWLQDEEIHGYQSDDETGVCFGVLVCETGDHVWDVGFGAKG